MATGERPVRRWPAGPTRALLTLGSCVVVLAAAACGAGDPATRRSGDSADPAAGTPSPDTTDAPDAAGSGGPTIEPDSAGRSRDGRPTIQISMAGQQFRATLTESAAARDLLAQLPATLQMRDHGGAEKTGRLRSPLSMEGQPEGADPDVGDVGYYAPGNDFVVYYGDQSYFPGIVVLGRLDDGAAARIADLAGSVTAVVDVVDD